MHMQLQKTSKIQNNLRKKTKAGGLTLPDSKLFYKAILTKMPRCWHKDTQMNSRE